MSKKPKESAELIEQIVSALYLSLSRLNLRDGAKDAIRIVREHDAARYDAICEDRLRLQEQVDRLTAELAEERKKSRDERPD
jgi:hypothetical protein